jgi:hypothetical protein
MESKPKGRKALVAGGTGEDDGCGLWCREADYPKSLLSSVTSDDDRAAMTCISLGKGSFVAMVADDRMPCLVLLYGLVFYC